MTFDERDQPELGGASRETTDQEWTMEREFRRASEAVSDWPEWKRVLFERAALADAYYDSTSPSEPPECDVVAIEQVPSIDEIAEALKVHRSAITEADEWRPLARHVHGLIRACLAGARKSWSRE